MHYYPAFFDLREERVLVVGGGKAALRRTLGLIETGAQVTVVHPELAPEFESLPVERFPRRFQPSDLRGVRMVFAASAQRSLNHKVALDARRAGIPVNVSDVLEESTFLIPARLKAGPVHLAWWTDGLDNTVTSELRRRLEELLRSFPTEAPAPSAGD
ncbi:MAG: NAD(P)-dependent oxidoreductase [Bryobacter sp.]|jgi:siroheme synthase-like protein|nr:NAD(P)-dependent oxidoreductase [Bryobacter sp.]